MKLLAGSTFRQSNPKREETKSIWQLYLGKQVSYITLLSEKNPFIITGMNSLLPRISHRKVEDNTFNNFAY